MATVNSTEEHPAKRLRYDTRRCTDARDVTSIRTPDSGRHGKNSFVETFEVLVGLERRTVMLYLSLMTERSAYFVKQRSHLTIENADIATDLSDVDFETFENYLRVVLKGQPVPRAEAVKQWESSGRPDDTWPEARKNIYSHLTDSISLYILAEKFEDPAAADIIIDDIVDLNSNGKGPMWSHMYDRIYDETLPDSPLRKLVRDGLLYEEDYKDVQPDSLPRQMLADFILEDARIKKSVWETEKTVEQVYRTELETMDPARYHRRPDEQTRRNSVATHDGRRDAKARGTWITAGRNDEHPTERDRQVKCVYNYGSGEDGIAGLGKGRFDSSFDVLVGPDQEKFVIHPGVIFGRSEFFKTSRKDVWKSKELETPTILEDDNPTDFHAYIEMLYTDRITLKDENMTCWIEAGCPKAEWTALEDRLLSLFEKLVRLYVLTDKFMDYKSTDIVIDELRRISSYFHKLLLPSELCEFIYANTVATSPLRKFIRDLIVYESRGDYITSDLLGKLPHDLLINIVEKDLAIKTKFTERSTTVRRAYDVRLSRLGKCRYHYHSILDPIH